MELQERIEARTARLAVVGLGYVGLPLAVEFGKVYDTLGFDINTDRVAELKRGEDRTLEVDPEGLRAAGKLTFTSDVSDLKQADVYIITVPTPVDRHRRPDLGPLTAASRSVGCVLERGNTVVYESTVYPGCTEEVCVPILEAASGLVFNRDFTCGYSPERINPGDKKHTLTTITKVTSGSTPEAAAAVDALYASIVVAGTYRASSVKVAEAAKVIENTQRDINIAFVNELSMIFNRLGIDALEVLDAAGTKWNFLPFRPGLVGGHCIGVDPYYLTQKAQEIGYHPQIILSGRRLNDGMGKEVASRVVKLMIGRGHRVASSRVLVLGMTFKENCPDVRNSRVIDVIRELEEYGCVVDVYDPWAHTDEVEREYGVRMLSAMPAGAPYDAVVVAVAHRQFVEMDFAPFRRENVVVFDVKGCLDRAVVDGRL